MINTTVFTFLLGLVLLAQPAFGQGSVYFCPTGNAVMSDGIHIVYRTVRLESPAPDLCTCAFASQINHYQIDPEGIATNSCADASNCTCNATQDPIGSSGGSSVLSFNPNDATLAYFDNNQSYDFWVKTDNNNIMRCFSLMTANGPARFAYKSTISDSAQLPSWVVLKDFTATESNDHITVTEPSGVFYYEKKVAN